MKHALILALATVGFTSSAFAADANLIGLSIGVGSEKMDYNYQTGGGCEDHAGVVKSTSVVTQKQGYKELVVTISMEDATKSGKADLCRAIVFVKGQVDLAQVVQDEIKKNGLDPQADIIAAKVVLPAVSVQP